MNRFSRAGLWLLAFLLIAACSGRKPTAQAPAAPVLTPTAAVQPTPVPTATPAPRVLTVCTQGQAALPSPCNLRPNLSQQTALALLNGSLPGEEVPAPLQLRTSELLQRPVAAGQMVLDTLGRIAPLVTDLQVWPAACRQPDCALNWDGQAEVSMDQWVYTFEITPGSAWQDGTPLTAADYLLAYQLSAADQSRANLWRHDLTQSLEASSETTLVWTLVPGLASPGEVGEVFPWQPLPAHQIPSDAAADCNALEDNTLSWGPYQLDAAGPADSLRFIPNAAYTGERNGLWGYDSIELRAIPDAQAALAAFAAGTCDVMDSSYRFEASDLEAHGAQASLQGPEPMSMLVMGVKPASYDDGHFAWSEERADFFGQPELREALWACLDLNAHYHALAAPLYPEGFAGPSHVHPAAPSLPDPKAALEALGWQDADGDPATPRTARGIETVRDGTALALSLLSGQSATDARYAAFVQEKLAACGMSITHQALSPQELYAPGPEGPLFGRSFDLALVYFQPSGLRYCLDQTALAVPSASNHWVGMNISGYSDPAADAACFAGAGPDQNAVAQMPNIAWPLIPHPQFWLGLPQAAQP